MGKHIITAIVSCYIGAGLSLGLVMQQVVPLNNLGVAVYAVTWPRHVYCARPGANCFSEASYLPVWFANMLFDLEARTNDPNATEYIRRDPATISALPEVQALIRQAVEAEREACAHEAEKRGWPGAMSVEQYASISDALEAEMDCGTEVAAAIRKRGDG